jgi:hypothetical protein
MDNDYRQYRKLILADREIAKTQEYYEGALYYGEVSDAHKRLKEIKKEVNELEEKLAQKTEIMDAIEEEIASFGKKKKPEGQTKKFIMPCQNADCRGLLSTQYKCDLCSKFTCSKCLLCIQGEKEEHECKPDDVASAEEIKKNTRPCPNCGCRISKIDGCDQMFCVECKTAFSWNKGTVETGNIHNPHYYEWMRKNGGNAAMPAARAGGGCENDFNAVGRYLANPPFETVQSTIRRIKEYLQSSDILGYARTLKNSWDLAAFSTMISQKFTRSRENRLGNLAASLSRFHQFMNHIEGDELDELRRSLRRNVENHNSIYEYILNRIDKTELSNHLIRLDAENMRWRARMDILEALVMVGRQMLTDCVIEMKQCFENHKNAMIPRFANENGYYRMSNLAWNKERYDYLTTVRDAILNYTDSYEQEVTEIMSKYSDAILKYATYSNIESIRHLLIYNSKKSLEVWAPKQNGDFPGRQRLYFNNKTEMYDKMNEFQRLYDEMNNSAVVTVHKMQRAAKKAKLADSDEEENTIVSDKP